MNKWTRRSMLKWLWVGVIMASLQTIQAALHLAGADALARGADAGFRALLPLARRDGPTPFPTPSEPPAGTATSNPTAYGDPTFTPEALPSATPSATGGATTTPTVAPTPTLTATGVPGRQPRVVHVHDARATHWQDARGWYGDHVDQDAVDAMLVRGLTDLTRTNCAGAAWGLLLPAYRPGQKIAVKINMNNSFLNDPGNMIDALIQPINALIRSLLSAGVQEDDVWVYDAIRPMPARFCQGRQFRSVRFFGDPGCAGAVAPFAHVHPSLRATFSHPALVRQRWLTDLLYQASYVINMPIIKKHGTHPVTLGFKNHFGSMRTPVGDGRDNPHVYINPTHEDYRSTYSPLVDIYANPNIAPKTVLTIGDALYGAPGWNAVPVPWRQFGNQVPNSLLFSRDPVAIDCVMCDMLRAEWGVIDAAYDYLRLAQERGLGTFERGEPFGSGYRQLDYVRVEN